MKTFEIEKLRQRDPEELSALFEYVAPRISKSVFSLQLTLPAEVEVDAQDIVMEVFSSLLRDSQMLAQRVAEGTLDLWCRKLTRNILVHICRRAVKKSARVQDTNEEKVYDTELVRAALSSLAEVDRQILMMRVVEEYSYPEMAKILGLSEGVVKVRLHRARALLRQYFHVTQSERQIS
jgi:RNA polymerase sigma-70 factor, ECF subfamily